MGLVLITVGAELVIVGRVMWERLASGPGWSDLVSECSSSSSQGMTLNVPLSIWKVNLAISTMLNMNPLKD
jgi:hypothetical protein